MIEIKHRRTGADIYRSETATTVREAVIECVGKAREIGADADLAGANLTGANLTGADLAGAYLTGANLTGANLTDADLTDANLAGANLTGANLTGADLAGANLTGANLTGANLTDADLTDANLAGADLTGADSTEAPSEPYKRDASRADRMARFRLRHPEVPVVENLDAKILGVVTDGGGVLDMSDWHTCDTTHCRAGWAITLAGKDGAKLEEEHGPYRAGAMIYRASTGRVPHFFASDSDALEDIKREAALSAEAT